MLFLLPTAFMVGLCVWLAQRYKGAAWGAGLGVTMVATSVNFYLLMPDHLQADIENSVGLH
ncbi:hypothetical protein [Deinococcus aquatilis]|uniref:hypothetical protein n=1 Tax=Deinococcus aquatilis TaxID=519440 RepID=UPI0012FAD79D|nr:hypothetical protein [Deinococcus aquatilis]